MASGAAIAKQGLIEMELVAEAYTLLQLFLDTLLGVTGSAAAPRPRRT